MKWSGGSSKRSAEQYRLVFLTVNEYYKRLTGCDYDEKCKNATRLSGMAHDPEVYYNPDAVPFVVDLTKKNVGRPRKSEEVRVKSCVDAVLRELERRGVVYAPGTHNKYISDACYMMNRLGFEQRRTKYSRGWNAIILTGNAIKEGQRLNAHRSAAE